MFDRREALKVGLFGAGALAFGGVGLSLRSTRMRAPTQALQCLDPQEFSIFAAVADRICPGNAPYPSAAQADVVHRIDTLLANSHPGFAGDIKQLVKLFENSLANFAFDGRPTPFTQMPPETQDAALADWQHSKLKIRRTGFHALRGLVVAAYFANPIVNPAVGYPGPPDIGPQGPLRQVPPSSRSVGGGS